MTAKQDSTVHGYLRFSIRKQQVKLQTILFICRNATLTDTPDTSWECEPLSVLPTTEEFPPSQYLGF